MVTRTFTVIPKTDNIVTPANNLSRSYKEPPSKIYAPIPYSAPSISAATRKIIAIARLIHKPDKIPGIAPGKTIL